MTNSDVPVTNTTEVCEDKPKGWGSLATSTYVKTAIIALLIGYLFRNELRSIFNVWQNDASWSHGFLIPLFSLWFLNQRKKDIAELRPRRSYVGLFLLVLCLVFYPLNLVQFKIGYFSRLVILPVIGSVVLFLGGWRLVKYTWLPICYLIFAVPMPDRLYRGATIPLRKFASMISTLIIDALPDVNAVASGVIINVVHRGQELEPLNVAEACSGMRLLIAFVALGVAMAYLHWRPLWQRGVLLLSTVPIAILCNVIRVTLTGMIYIYGDPKYAKGTYHDMMGIAMLFAAFAMYGGIAWFMSNLFEEDDGSGEPKEEEVIVRRSAS
ncbi:exosortase D, VPLPA-CTERM-specific [Anaerohalosphaera lusitana]|uniref:Exosortase D, VPLPA-CTERM-specific n=2 Tax=Anaerohalosphaera lusitana TaxID=1936003 RepID=A0A1U9NPQ7_9BACT|nr:exosortase D, VPLPA-CTERM-specific [Anaerohalosphaera lusitana]